MNFTLPLSLQAEFFFDMISDFTFWLEQSKQGNQVVYIQYTSSNNNSKKKYWVDAIVWWHSLRRKNHITRDDYSQIVKLYQLCCVLYAGSHKES